MNVKEERINLYDLNEQTSKSDFEARVFSGLGRNLSNLKMTRVNEYTTTKESVLKRQACKDSIFKALLPESERHDQMAAEGEKRKRFWHDQKKGTSIEDIAAVVECDLFLKFDGDLPFQKFTAKSLFGHVADKVFTITKGDDIDLASIHLSGGSIRCEITSEPGCLRHKLYQLERAKLCIPDSDVKLHVIAINGALEDAMQFVAVAKDGMQNLPDEYHQIPCVVIWTKTRNVFSAIKSLERRVEGLEKRINCGFFLVVVCMVALGFGMLVLSSQMNERLDTLFNIMNQKNENAVVNSHGASLSVLSGPGVGASAVPVALGVAMVVLSSQNTATRNELNSRYDMLFNILNQKNENAVVGIHGADVPVLGWPVVDSCAVQASGLEEGGRYDALMGIYGIATAYGEKQHQELGSNCIA